MIFDIYTGYRINKTLEKYGSIVVFITLMLDRLFMYQFNFHMKTI